jgi:hypothetical protein
MIFINFTTSVGVFRASVSKSTSLVYLSHSHLILLRLHTRALVYANQRLAEFQRNSHRRENLITSETALVSRDAKTQFVRNKNI